MNFARRDSGHLVMSEPSTMTAPESTKNDPATALRSVDFPDPLVPMMMTNERSWTFSRTPRSARSSFAVPALKVLLIPATSSMGCLRGRLLPQGSHPLQQRRHNQGQEHEHRGRQFQVVGVESHAQCDRHQQPEQYRANNRAGNTQPQRPRSDQRLADDHA